MSAILRQQKFNDDYSYCAKKRTYPPDEGITDHFLHKRAKHFSSPIFSLPPSLCSNARGLKDNFSFNFIDFRNDNNNRQKSFPRIVDLTTGEQLEPISEQKESKRSLEFKTLYPQENFDNTDDDDSDDDSDDFINFNKKFRVSEKPTVNYIEEEGLKSTIDNMQELRLNSKTITSDSISTSDSNSKNGDKDTDATNEHTQNMSIVTRDTAKKLQFTVKYQRAFSKYMRSQFEYVKDEMQEGAIILYYPNLYQNLLKVINNKGDNTINAEEGKITEISDDENVDVEMSDVDSAENTNAGNDEVMEIEPLDNEPLDNELEEYMEVDEMDIDL